MEKEEIELSKVEKLRIAERQKYLETHLVSDPENIFNNCILEKNGFLTISEGDYRQGGVIAANGMTLVNPDYFVPYWRTVKNHFDKHKKTQYYDKLVAMLKANNVWDDIQACFNAMKYGDIYTKADRDMLLKKINKRNLEQFNKTFIEVEKILNEAELFAICRTLNNEGKELSSDEKLMQVANRIRVAKQIVTNQKEINKMEQSGRRVENGQDTAAILAGEIGLNEDKTNEQEKQ